MSYRRSMNLAVRPLLFLAHGRRRVGSQLSDTVAREEPVKEDFICQVCGQPKMEGEWVDGKGNVCSDCLLTEEYSKAGLLDNEDKPLEAPMLRGQVRDAATALRFMFAGNAYFTLVSRATGTRFTYRMGQPKRARKEERPWYYLSLLNGPDNERNYTWMGTICSDGAYRVAKVSLDAPSSKAFQWAWKKFKDGVFPEELEFWHEGRCGRCGRMLTVPEYRENGVVVAGVALGIGPECAGRL